MCGGGSTGHEAARWARRCTTSRAADGRARRGERAVLAARRHGIIEFPRDFVNTGVNSRTFWQAEPEILELQQVWDAEVVEDGTKRLRPANVLTFAGEPGAPAPPAHPSPSAPPSSRASTRPRIRADPGSPSPLPPPSRCRGHRRRCRRMRARRASDARLIAGYGTAATLMHVTVDRWVDGSEVEFQFGRRRWLEPNRAGAGGARQLGRRRRDHRRERQRVAPRERCATDALTSAPPARLLRRRPRRRRRARRRLRAAACKSCERTRRCRLRRAAAAAPSSSTAPSAATARTPARARAAGRLTRSSPSTQQLAPPRVSTSSVVAPSSSRASGGASSALRFRLAATAADASSAFEFETRDDARLSPASAARSSSSPIARRARAPHVRRHPRRGDVTLSLQSPRWCHHLGGDSCE